VALGKHKSAKGGLVPYVIILIRVIILRLNAIFTTTLVDIIKIRQI
jgi:hypothetical protein